MWAVSTVGYRCSWFSLTHFVEKRDLFLRACRKWRGFGTTNINHCAVKWFRVCSTVLVPVPIFRATFIVPNRVLHVPCTNIPGMLLHTVLRGILYPVPYDTVPGLPIDVVHTGTSTGPYSGIYCIRILKLYTQTRYSYCTL
jgi:hypothetical protein